jgi:hypothetical protein
MMIAEANPHGPRIARAAGRATGGPPPMELDLLR